MQLPIKEILKHLAVVVGFILVALLYFNPVLNGKVIFQSDIVQHKGMANERDTFKKQTGEESYWTNSAFGGMPTYQVGANYPNNYIKKLDKLIRFLPRPADYLFLYFIGFYILMLCMKVDFKLAVLGALAFGLSTYMIIILGVGHNAKAHAIGYMPMVLGGILLVFQKRYMLGFLLTALAMGLEISANHFQMTYYFGLLVIALGIVYLIDAIRKKELKAYFTAIGILVGAVVLALGTNATNLMATSEYTKWSTRGKSELTINPDGSEKIATGGLDKEYITQYSYGIAESLNLFVPRLFGGSGSESLGKDSEVYSFLTARGYGVKDATEFVKNLPLYWGDQPIVAAPAYIGAVVFFLFVLALFLVKGNTKKWLLAGVLLSLLLSWGKNFAFLTNFMIDYFPLYNKFRAVSSIQVVLELCIPVLAILGLSRLLDSDISEKQKVNALKYSAAITLGLGVLLLLFKGMFSFEGASDATYLQYFGEDLVERLREDRRAVYSKDVFRTLVFIALVAGIIWAYIKEKVSQVILLITIGVLLILDLGGIAKRYVNADDFVKKRKMEQPFVADQADKLILADKSIFRVFDISEGLNGARTSYFHNSIGGYHGAKPAKIQDLFDFHLYAGNTGVLDMLNVKYIVQPDEKGQKIPVVNENANGNAWFVSKTKAVLNADEEILGLKDLDTKTEAIYDSTKSKEASIQQTYQVDSTATIVLQDYAPNYLKYSAINTNDGLAVFSEMYYANGWKSFIDGQEVAHFPVNYALRGMVIPKGKHSITFKFEPEVVKKGSTIALISAIILFLILIAVFAAPYLPFLPSKTEA